MSVSIRLSIRRGGQEVASASAGPSPLKIGRSKQCDVILEDPAVSRVHAVLSLEGANAVLTDQGSQNGLWVQGNRVTRVVLDPSVVVAMGPFRIVCEAVATAQGSDATMLRPRPGAAASGGPAPPPGATPVLPTTDKTGAAQPAAAGSPSSQDTEKRPALPNPDAAIKLPPPRSVPPAALARKKAASAQTSALLVIAAVFMIIIGGSTTVLWLKWRNSAANADSGQTAAASGAGPSVGASAGGTAASSTTSQPAVTSTAAVEPSATTAEPAGDGVAPAPSAPPGADTGTSASVPAIAAPPASPDTPSAPATSTRPAASEAPAGIVPAGKRPRESRAAWIRRSTELTSRLNQGKAAIDRGDYAGAIDILSGVQRDEPNFGDTAAQLARARDGLKASNQARAQAAFDEGQQKERQQDFIGALRSYQQAEKIDADFAPRVAPAIAAAKAQQKAIVDDLFKKANAEFAFRRPSAIPLYQRILKLLAEDDPRRNEAQTKLNQLLGGKE